MPPRVPSALMGGLAAALLVIIFNYLSSTGGFPPNPVYGCFACLSFLTCGLVAVWHYTTEHSLTLTGGQGVVLGLLSGVFAGVIAALVGYVLMALGALPGPEEMIEEMERSGLLDQPGSSVHQAHVGDDAWGPLGSLSVWCRVRSAAQSWGSSAVPLAVPSGKRARKRRPKLSTAERSGRPLRRCHVRVTAATLVPVCLVLRRDGDATSVYRGRRGDWPAPSQDASRGRLN